MKYMIRGADYALLLYGNGKDRALYDLQADPEQRPNVIDEQYEIADDMLAVFSSFAMRQRRPPLHFLHRRGRPLPLSPSQKRLSPETKKNLRALGCLR